MIRGLLLSIAFLSVGQVFGQTDTLRLMQYNLLNYRNTTTQCTNSTNNADDKDGYLQTIVEYVKPDVILANEMGSNWLNPNKILTNALNKNGVNYYDQAEFSNNGFSNLTNMLFFNKNKLTLHKQAAVSKNAAGADLVRVIDVYTLYMNYPRALAKGDTVFLTFFLAHLKAGSGTSDKTERNEMTTAAMDYLMKNHQPGSYFFAGDFNIQTHSEASYQTLTKNSAVAIRFYDPKNAAGNWNNNSNYANLHTQSSHSGDTRGGCFSGGGMDDRFDFILCGKEVLDDVYNVRYVSGSYKALGQDSRRFNGDIKTPSSNIIPTEISNALYEMSDHLPVLMDIEVTDENADISDLRSRESLIINYLPDNQYVIYLPKNGVFEKVLLYDNLGKHVGTYSSKKTSNELRLSLHNFTTGMYLIKAIGQNGETVTQKVLVK